MRLTMLIPIDLEQTKLTMQDSTTESLDQADPETTRMPTRFTWATIFGLKVVKLLSRHRLTRLSKDINLVTLCMEYLNHRLQPNQRTI